MIQIGEMVVIKLSSRRCACGAVAEVAGQWSSHAINMCKKCNDRYLTGFNGAINVAFAVSRKG